jgi:Uma2 family endonuclease
MPSDAAVLDNRPPATASGRRKLTLDDVYAMMKAGILVEGERTELIEGELFVMASEGDLHVDHVDLLFNRLRAALGPEFDVYQRDVLNRRDDTQLSPDIAVWPAGTRARNKTPENVLLIVEVSDTTARGDKKGKAGIYARLGVPELWIMDVRPRRLLVHRGASDGAWPKPTPVEPGDSVAPLFAPSAAVTVPKL